MGTLVAIVVIIVAFFFSKDFRNLILFLVAGFWIIYELFVKGNWEFLLIFSPLLVLLIYILITENKKKLENERKFEERMQERERRERETQWRKLEEMK